MSILYNQPSIKKKHITLVIISYIFTILLSLSILILVIAYSNNHTPQFIVSSILIWIMFFLFCVFKILRAKGSLSGFKKGTLSVTELDHIDGIAFEKLVCEILVENGFDIAENTSATRDYGVDVLATRDGMSYAIQCKRYLEPVGLDAIQQVYAGRAYYECHVAVVLTNQTFTQNAQNLADKLGVVLWDREVLRDMLSK